MSGVLSLLVASGRSLSATKSGDADATGTSPPNIQSLSTNTVTVTPAGGAGSYTHSWAFVSGDAVFTISNAAAAAVAWTVTVGLVAKSAVWRDTVSDGVSTTSVDVNVSAVVI